MARALPLLLPLILATHTVLACSSTLDCSLNGVCVDSNCICDDGWEGIACEKLVLLPMKPSQIEHNTAAYRVGDTTSWGGSVLYDEDDGKYHMFVSVLANNCTLSSWLPNSKIVHTISSSPTGPFTEKEVLFDTFHHNPTVRALPKGQGYLLFFIGGHLDSTECTPVEDNRLQAPIVSFSKNLNGPWTKPSSALLDSGGEDAWDYLVTNPSPLVLSNGTILLYYRGSPKGGNDMVERIGLAISDHWKGPYRRICGGKPIISAANEDPFVWRDAKGYSHMLTHGGDQDWHNIHHSYSIDGLCKWSNGNDVSVTPSIMLTNGTIISMTQRERPQIYIDERDAMSVLVTGVCPGKKYEYGFTIAQCIGGSV